MLIEKNKEQFKKVLIKKLDELLLKNGWIVDNIRNHSGNCADPFDRAAFICERDISIKIQERDDVIMEEIIDALRRLDEGTYKICEECQGDIAKKRLLATPVTILCIECKIRQEEREKIGRWYSIP